MISCAVSAHPNYIFQKLIECKHAVRHITFVKRLNQELALAVDEQGIAEFLNYHRATNSYRDYFKLPQNLYYPIQKIYCYKSPLDGPYHVIIRMIHNKGHFNDFIITDINSQSVATKKLDLQHLKNSVYRSAYGLDHTTLNASTNIQDHAFSYAEHSNIIQSFEKRIRDKNLLTGIPPLCTLFNFFPIMSYHEQNDMLVMGHTQGFISIWKKVN